MLATPEGNFHELTAPILHSGAISAIHNSGFEMSAAVGPYWPET
jgi:hypothetical protein